MTETEVFTGHYCPKCRTTVGVYLIVGGQGACPGCGGPLQAELGGPQTRVITNFCCESCGARIGMLTAVGGNAVCPGCGKAIS